MKLLFNAVLLASLLFATQPLFAPTHVGSGGDVALCRASPREYLKASYYSLDYLLTSNFGRPWDTWENELQRVKEQLYYNMPGMYEDYVSFLDSLFVNHAQARYRWFAEDSLPDVADEDLEVDQSELPGETCNDEISGYFGHNLTIRTGCIGIIDGIWETKIRRSGSNVTWIKVFTSG